MSQKSRSKILFAYLVDEWGQIIGPFNYIQYQYATATTPKIDLPIMIWSIFKIESFPSRGPFQFEYRILNFHQIFIWEPALWTLNSQERVMMILLRSQKSIAIFGYKQSLLSIDMKTKVVQHVESQWMREWESERVRKWENERVWESDLVPSFCLTFRHFLE